MGMKYLRREVELYEETIGWRQRSKAIYTLNHAEMFMDINWMMLINNGITGVIFGTLSGGLISWLFIKRNEKKDNSEKIYSPLLTEFRNHLNALTKDFSLTNYSLSIRPEEWIRITQKDHLTHRIKPKIRQHLEIFYEETSKSHQTKFKSACEKIKEVVDKELNQRWDGGYTLENTYHLTEYLYPAFIAGRLLNNEPFLKQKLTNLNLQLKKKYRDLDDFFEENLKMLDQKKEIKEAREEQIKMIEHINLIIRLLEKELK